MRNSKAVVILSGGQDSVTCLGIAKAQHEEVYAITFSYGQKHDVEVAVASAICAHMDIDHKVVDISFLAGMVNSALTSNGNVNEKHPDNPDLPASFVPNRNALFITLSHAYAQKIGAQFVYTGVCETDFSGYPDCRDGFITDITCALNKGSGTDITTVTPLMYLDKAQTFAVAQAYGVLEIVLKMSHTCYNGDHETLNDWGYGCGECPACELRAKGWAEYQQREGDKNG